MQLVILAGGLGTRMREETEFVPKPMVRLGNLPVLVHIMRWYSYHGIRRFVIAGGYKIEVIREYFALFPASALDFRVTNSELEVIGENPFEDWEITVADTGLSTSTGGRLLDVQKYIDEDSFMCTYGDGLSNVDIAQLLQFHREKGALATMTITKPISRFGVVRVKNGFVDDFTEKPESSSHINIGHFVFEKEALKYFSHHEPLENGPLNRLAERGALSAFMHDDFFEPMDTYREFQKLSELLEFGAAPWCKK